MESKGKLVLIGVGALLAWQVVQGTIPRPIPLDPPARARDTTPGITRVGAAKAAQAWKDLPTLPGVKKWRCDQRLCTVQFDPVLWVQMDYDLKNSLLTMTGIALTHGENARWVEVVDRMTGKKLGGYHAQTDVTSIEP